MVGFKDLCLVLLACCCSIDFSKSSTSKVIDHSSSFTDESVTDLLTLGTATPVVDSSTIPVETSVTDSLLDGTATPVIDSSTIPVETSITDTLLIGTATLVFDSSTPVETSVPDSLLDGTTTLSIDTSTFLVETSVTDSITASSVIDSSYSPTPSTVTDFPTSTTEPETTQPPPTTRPPQDISTSKPNLDTALFVLDLKIEVELDFLPALINNTSTEYEEWNRELIPKLTAVYTRIPGFLYLAVTGFTNGSVIGHYQVNIKANEPSVDVLDAFNGNFLTEMNNLTIFTTQAEPFNETNDILQIHETIGDKCKATGICPTGFSCSGGKGEEVTCLSTCLGDACQYGQCHISTDGDHVCKCDISEDFVYSGDKCDIKTEKLSMEIDAIAGIAGGLGGGIILLLVIALVVTCCSRRKKKTKRHHGEDEFYLTGLEGDIWGKDAGEVNPAADTNEEYGYRGALGEDQRYQSWLMQQDKPETNSKRQSRSDDFRKTSNGGYPGNRNHSNERQELEQMESAALFSRAMPNTSSGLRTGHCHEDVLPDYDSDDADQFAEEKHKDNWDVGSDRPVTHFPRGQSRSRAFKNEYSQEGHNARSQPMKSKSRPVKDDYGEKGDHAWGQPMKSKSRPVKDDYGEKGDHALGQPMNSKSHPVKDNYGEKGDHAWGQPMKSKPRSFRDQPIKSEQRPFKYDDGQEDFMDSQLMQRQPRLLNAGYKQGQSVYNSIETDKKYVIRRPTLN